MSRRKKLIYVAGVAGVTFVVAGLGAAGAIAASDLFSPSEESKAVIDDAASQLGVEPSELSDALKQALKNRVDEAVDAGRLTKEQAKELKERIDADRYPLLFGRGGHGGLGGLGGFGRHGHVDVLETAAAFLGMTRAELREELEDKTLAEIAREKGKTAAGLVQQLVATQTKRIDEAVADGRLTDDQATGLKADLEERMESLVNDRPHRLGDRGQSRFWPGSGSARAPPFFGGPPA
jgi:polyhydroxyalkanoate synthesis regulator phasin